MIPTKHLLVLLIAIGTCELQAQQSPADLSVGWDELQGIQLQSLPALPNNRISWPSPRRVFAVDAPTAQPVFGSRPLPGLRPSDSEFASRPETSTAWPEFTTAWLTSESAVGGDVPNGVRSQRATQRGADRPASLLARNLRWISRASSESLVVSVAPATSTDLSLLSRRIADHNRAIRRYASILKTRQHWSVSSLESITLKLAELMRRRRVWTLHYTSLDEHQRRAVARLAPVDDLLDLFGQRLFETEITGAADLASVSRYSREETRRRLKILNERLLSFSK